jgi:hypothetical protein
MELGEEVAVEEIDDDNWECPFSHDKAGVVQNDLNTSASKLGTCMGNGTSTRKWDDSSGTFKPKKIDAPKQKKTDVIAEPHEVFLALDHLGNSIFTPFSVAAHHLIPGEASLPESSLIGYIKGGDIISSDIGYGVNGRENGIWLPTHHALSQHMPVLPFQTEAHAYASMSSEGNDTVGSTVSMYTQAVMERTNCQFHDDHTSATDYSNFVIRVLNKIHANLVAIKSSNCDKCKEVTDAGGKLPPPHSLVYRLNNVSTRLAGFLVGSPRSWRPPVYTSPHARSFASSARRLAARGR